MKKRTVIIGALVSLMPLGQPLVMGMGAVLTSAGVMLTVPKRAQAESAVFFYNRGNDKLKAGDYYGAISDYNRALEINPSVFYYKRGQDKFSAGDYFGAIADYTRSIEINPSRANPYFNRAYSKYKLKDYSGAIADYTRAIEINPSFTLAYDNRENAKKKLKEQEEKENLLLF